MSYMYYKYVIPRFSQDPNPPHLTYQHPLLQTICTWLLLHADTIITVERI